MPTFMAIDGNSLMHRAFHAIPLLNNAKGEYTNAVHGFLGMLLRLIREEDPKYIAVAFDMPGPTFRHKIFEEYKGDRKATPDELKPQFAMLKEALEALGIKTIEKESLEADDLLGCLAKEATKNDLKTLLVTGDKDTFQLVTDDVTVLFTRRGISQTDRMTPQAVKEDLGVLPKSVTDLKGLMGDNSDNIPGVPGVGPKTANQLLDEYGTLENVLEHAQDVSGPKLRQSLTDYAEQAKLSKELATIVDDRDCGIALEDYAFAYPNLDDVRPTFQELGFTTLMRRLEDDVPEEKLGTPTNKIEIKEHTDIKEIAKLLDAKETAIYIKQDTMHIATDKKTDHVFTFSNTLLNEGVSYENATLELKPFLENEKNKLVLFDAKTLAHQLRQQEIHINAMADDAMLAAYVVDPAQGQKSLSELSQKYIHTDTENSDNAAALFALMQALRKEIENSDMQKLYGDMELPLWRVLYDMEVEGFRVDLDTLAQMSKEYEVQIKDIESKIIELAGEEFNVNSPQKLSTILFEKLKLTPGKRTKTGYSTNIEVLESIRDEHPIIDLIIEYRSATKLKSTYLDGLSKVADKATGKIHTNFKQNIAATGRISSTDPNLQNIPIRTEQGREIRRAFIPSKPENILVTADYSQIELRILAHICGDKNLIAAFEHGDDIHARTASEVFDVPMDKMTPDIRSAAKAVNFGIIYGIGEFSLSKNLDITVAQAKDYIDKYLARYPKVHEYMEKSVEDAKEKGYAQTMFGRRRYVNELKSRNYNVRSFGERIAMNAPIQGSAADIIKIAMINVYNTLEKELPDSKLILQVHDELIVDCPIEKKDTIAEILKNEMQDVVKLDVPLNVDVGSGKTWLDAK